MANSNLLKEAIADAKAVRETAIANAKIALEEAFTPRLQSILSQKLQQEIEEGDDEDEVNEEYSDGAEAPDADASDIGDGDNKQPADDANSSSDLAQGNPDTDAETAEVGSEDENTEKAAEISEGEESEEEESVEETVSEDSHEEVDETYGEEEEGDDELDLESIIRELEEELEEDSHEEEADHQEELDAEEKEEVEDIADDAVDSHEEEKHEEGYGHSEEEEVSEEEDLDEEIDLNEILREMGYGEDEESEEVSETEEVEEGDDVEEIKAELEEAMSTIKELKSTINEVNLLNAKLLYTNKLFRSYDLTNDQKMKVVETLDRTGNVREVKLVFSTLAESFKFNGTAKKQKSSKINESFASKPVASTAPKKEVITESTNAMADRFKKLANIR